MHYNPALLIIDLQNDFVKFRNSPVFIPSAQTIIPVINNLRELFDSNNRKIFNIITVHPDDINQWGAKDIELKRAYCIENSAGAEIIDELLPLKKNELLIKKKFYSGFFETGLLEQLKKYDISTLLFAGLTTGCCVSSTARDAYNFRFELFFVEDALTASSIEAHKTELVFFQKSLGKVINFSEISKLIK